MIWGTQQLLLSWVESFTWSNGAPYRRVSGSLAIKGEFVPGLPLISIPDNDIHMKDATTRQVFSVWSLNIYSSLVHSKVNFQIVLSTFLSAVQHEEKEPNFPSKNFQSCHLL